MMEFSHACQIFKRSEIIRKHFCAPKLFFPTVVDGLMGFSHACHKFLWSQKIRKIPKKIAKIIQKFPHLLERAENAENAWEIPENRGKNPE